MTPVWIEEMALAALEFDDRLQPRADGQLDEDHVLSLEEEFALFPGRWPPTVPQLDVFLVRDLPARQGRRPAFLAGGHHRYAALKRSGRASAQCKVREGAWLDAFRFALGQNRTHGKRRTPADVRHAAFLAFAESARGTRMPNTAIAEAIGITHQRVAQLRQEWDETSNIRTPAVSVYVDPGDEDAPVIVKAPVPMPQLEAAAAEGFQASRADAVVKVDPRREHLLALSKHLEGAARELAALGLLGEQERAALDSLRARAWPG